MWDDALLRVSPEARDKEAIVIASVSESVATILRYQSMRRAACAFYSLRNVIMIECCRQNLVGSEVRKRLGRNSRVGTALLFL